MVAQVGYLVAERSRGRVAPCVVCTMHVETRSVGFLVDLKTKVNDLSVVWPQNHWDGFLQFSLKTGGDGFCGLASKPVATVSWLSFKPRWWRFSQFGPQNWRLRFCDLGHKITVTISWFGPQNHVGFGLSVAPQNQWMKVDAGHASRSSSLLHVEASRARVSQFGDKIGRGTMAGGARGTITEVASESS
jgi:hypothetical protein